MTIPIGVGNFKRNDEEVTVAPFPIPSHFMSLINRFHEFITDQYIPARTARNRL